MENDFPKKYKRGQKPDHRWANWVSNFIEHFGDGVRGGRFYYDGYRPQLTVGVGANHYKDMAWGIQSYDNDNKQVTINGGIVYWGTSTPHEVSDTVVTVSGGSLSLPQYVYFEANISGSANGSIIATASGGVPGVDGTKWRTPLVAAYYDAGTSKVKIARIHQAGCPIVIPLRQA